ncbi:uncharacterized protein LOC136087240 [Hydra vulgaris]|uniref:Uncharacterized protein LOC136087240 n=1 Tax=Hydra vulgaris TaxID=6087 RepID=A0ABM4CV26_HYDVU
MFIFEKEMKVNSHEIFFEEDNRVFQNEGCPKIKKKGVKLFFLQKDISKKSQILNSIDSGINDCKTIKSTKVKGIKKNVLKFFQSLFSCFVSSSNEVEEQVNTFKEETPDEILENSNFIESKPSNSDKELSFSGELEEFDDDKLIYLNERNSFISLQTEETLQIFNNEETNKPDEKKKEKRDTLEKIDIGKCNDSLEVEDEFLSTTDAIFCKSQDEAVSQNIDDNLKYQEVYVNKELELTHMSNSYTFIVVILFTIFIMTFKSYCK